MLNFNQIKEKSWIIILFSIFLFSFILDLYLLTRYNLSYGRDGPFYDLQVLKIIQTGFTASNDPPLVYYMLTPFVLIIKNSFLGIKIGMALFGSLMAFPAFFLTETFNKNGSKVPALLSAFLITINAAYFSMIGDFMQNLVGVFFLLLLLYFMVKWLENTSNWKKYGIITIFLLVCSILTHIYTGMLAVLIFTAIIILNTIIKAVKTRKLPLFDLKIFGLIGVLIIGGLTAMFIIYPVMFSKFTTVISFFNGTSSSSMNSPTTNNMNIMVFLTIPFLLGIFAAIKILYNGLKKKIDIKNNENSFNGNGLNNLASKINKEYLSKETILSAIYLIIAFVLIFLAAFPSEYQSRFILLAFVPIALIVPLGLQLIENLIHNKYPTKKSFRIGLISIIAILFAISSFYTASGEFSSMGPSISSEQYDALLKIKADYVGNEIGSNSVIIVNGYHMGYWVQYVLGVDVVTGNTSEILSNNSKSTDNSTMYQIQITENQIQNSQRNSEYLWNPLLPYAFPIGFDLNLVSNQQANGPNDHLNPSDNLTSNNSFPGNRSNGPPGIGNSSNHNNSLIMGNGTFNSSNAPPSGFGNSSNTLANGIAPNGINVEISSEGTLIFSLNNVKIYKIS